MTQRSICFLPLPSWRRTSCFAVYRNDSPLALQQMAEPQDRSPFVLDVVRCGHQNVRVAQHLARGRQAVAGVDLASVFFAERVERGLRADALRAKPHDQLLDLALAAVVIIESGRSGRHRGFDQKPAPPLFARAK